MARVGVKLNHGGIQQLLDGGSGVDSALDDAAERVAAAWRNNAPVVTGDYRDSIHIETDHTDRMRKRVVADVSYAMVVEANTGVGARSMDAAR